MTKIARARKPKPSQEPPAHIRIPVFHRLYIPGWHPTRLNEMIGRHRMVIAKRKQKDRAVLGVWLWGKVIPPLCRRRVRLTIHLAPRQRAADPDAYWKSLLDAMVHCGLLIDDNRQNVVLDPVEFVRGAEMGTTIELYDLEPMRS